jgi:cellulose synthase/poly-beta-1,6-N-acetylglucosamine synthase-like glycosyltransferase
MIKKGKEPWRISSNSNYLPSVSLIVPTYNEATVIGKKLENIQKLDYPADKLEIIIVDSGSSDKTLDICEGFLEKNKVPFQIKLISEHERLGKSHALNTALKYAVGEIIATSDADAFWEPDALRKAVSYFADPKVGAVTGRERLINIQRGVHTMAEGIYRKFYYTMRLGESKIHSTLVFQGELALYRKSAFNRFEDTAGYADDTGTVINIMSNGYRCIFVPEAVFCDTAAFSLKGKLTLKSRRAQHLIAGILRSTRLKFAKKLQVSSIIIIFNLYLHVISPILLTATLLTTTIMYIVYFQSFWYLALLFLPFIFVKKLRLFLVSYLTSNLALIMGLIRHITKKRSKIWHKVEEMRSDITFIEGSR